MTCECGHCVGMGTAWDSLEKKLCPEGKAAAKKNLMFTHRPMQMVGLFNTARASSERRGRKNDEF